MQGLWARLWRTAVQIVMACAWSRLVLMVVTLVLVPNAAHGDAALLADSLSEGAFSTARLDATDAASPPAALVAMLFASLTDAAVATCVALWVQSPNGRTAIHLAMRLLPKAVALMAAAAAAALIMPAGDAPSWQVVDATHTCSWRLVVRLLWGSVVFAVSWSAGALHCTHPDKRTSTPPFCHHHNDKMHACSTAFSAAMRCSQCTATHPLSISCSTSHTPSCPMLL